MPDARLQRARETLPTSYQFGENRKAIKHAHEFNPMSGYCACGLQFVPELLDAFPNGGYWDAPDGRRHSFITRIDQREAAV